MIVLSQKAQQSIERVIAKLKTGDISDVTKMARIQLSKDAPANKWSPYNQFLAFAQSGELDCRGFVQWKHVGRRIKPGSKAIHIIRPHLISVETSDHDEPEKHITGFSTIPVFPASVTEGEPLETYEPVEVPALLDVTKKLGITVSYLPMSPDRYGDCDVSGKTIRLGTHHPKVFFHELSHAVHARLEGDLVGTQNEYQEVTAELTATILMDLYGYGDYTGDAWRYIRKYSKDPVAAIARTSTLVTDILELILA